MQPVLRFEDRINSELDCFQSTYTMNVLLILFSGCYIAANNALKLVRDATLDGSVSSEYTIFRKTAPSKIGCVAECSREGNCSSIFYQTASKECTACFGTTVNSMLQSYPGALHYRKEVVWLDGRIFSIICVDNEKKWHYDASWSNDYVSALWQPNDQFVQFKFELQTDYSYKIKSIGGGVYLFDGYGVFGAQLNTLNGKAHQDDDHARFIVTRFMEGRYRIQTKATQRLLRLDENLMVSSLINIEDQLALFKFTEV